MQAILATLGQEFIDTRWGTRCRPIGDTVLPRDIPWLIGLYRRDHLKLDELISGRWPFDRINNAILDAKSGSALRNVVLFG